MEYNILWLPTGSKSLDDDKSVINKQDDVYLRVFLTVNQRRCLGNQSYRWYRWYKIIQMIQYNTRWYKWYRYKMKQDYTDGRVNEVKGELESCKRKLVSNVVTNSYILILKIKITSRSKTLEQQDSTSNLVAWLGLSMSLSIFEVMNNIDMVKRPHVTTLFSTCYACGNTAIVTVAAVVYMLHRSDSSNPSMRCTL